MILAQITDTHIETGGKAAFGRVDTAAALERCIDLLHGLDPAPDLVLHTGDLVDRRTPEEYARFREIIARLKLPFYAIPGNHDAREPMRAAFADAGWMPREGEFLHYAIDTFPVRILALDCIVPRSGSGALCEARLRWLEERLEAQPSRPTVVALHHPPFATGLPEIDRGGFGNQDRFAAVLRRHPQVERVICGHVHRAITTRFGGTVATAAPAVCYQFALDTREGAPLSYAFEPPGLYLHVWREGEGLLTHLLPIGDYGPPIPFLKDGKMLRLQE